MSGYGNHPYGTMHKRDLPRHKSVAPQWRTRDGLTHKVTVRHIAPKVEVTA